MKNLLFISFFLFASTALFAQSDEDSAVYNESAILEKLTKKATAEGYTQKLQLSFDTSKSFRAVPGKAYRLILIFRDNITTPGRRLVVYQRNDSNELKRLYMAKAVNGFKEFRGKAMVTDVAAQPLGETFLKMKIDALPAEGKLYIFTN